MTAPVPTPVLDKAASEDLTSSEIMQALRELTALDPDQRRFGLTIDPQPVSDRHLIAVTTRHGRPSRSSDTIEDALIWQHVQLLEISAEIEADA